VTIDPPRSVGVSQLATALSVQLESTVKKFGAFGAFAGMAAGESEDAMLLPRAFFAVTENE